MPVAPSVVADTISDDMTHTCAGAIAPDNQILAEQKQFFCAWTPSIRSYPLYGAVHDES
jgi:hypothetical protein